MPIAIIAVSIFAIAGAVWLLNKFLASRTGRLHFRICPICAGVAGTWLWMFAARFLGYHINETMLALLVGGSVVGIAYQAEKRLPPERSTLLWKALFMPVGFVTAYGAISSSLILFVIASAVLFMLVVIFFRRVRPRTPEEKASTEVLKKKMEQCC